jgi:carboxyl-terminal processing protease
MRLTVSRYYTPSGHAIQADGVHPDVAVETTKPDGAVSYREKDLEGHLSAESAGGSNRAPKSVIVVGGDGGTPAAAAGRDARNVPDDPESSDADPVLTVGWRMLHHAVERREPSP